MENEILELIRFIKNQMKKMRLDATEVFLNGDCGNFYSILSEKFSESIPYLISYKNVPLHIVTKIKDKFYDVTGETSLEDYIKYVKERNNAQIYDELFDIQNINNKPDYIKKMSDMYDYDENWNQSNIQNEINRLYASLKNRDKEDFER